jgi:hypothetical protein
MGFLGSVNALGVLNGSPMHRNAYYDGSFNKLRVVWKMCFHHTFWV